MIMARPATDRIGLPCVVALLPSKETAVYIKLFEIVKAKVGDVSGLATLIQDFERAVFTSTQHVFPGVEQRGCRFHHNAAVWKKLGEKGLQGLFYQSYSFQVQSKITKQLLCFRKRNFCYACSNFFVII